jgi:hydrogenase-4 component E
MTGSPYAAALTLAVGSVLVCAITVLWVTSTRSVIRVVAIQGVALGLVAMILGIHLRDAGLIGAATVVLLVKGAAIPLLLGKASGTGTVHSRESRPIVNVPASLVASVFLIVLAFAAFRDVARFVGTTAGALVPVGVATLLIGFFALATRQRPLFQMAGLLMVDNGTALVAFLCTAGVPFLVEVGVSLDVLLGVTVLMVLTMRLRTEFGDVDLDELRELHD